MKVLQTDTRMDKAKTRGKMDGTDKKTVIYASAYVNQRIHLGQEYRRDLWGHDFQERRIYNVGDVHEHRCTLLQQCGSKNREI